MTDKSENLNEGKFVASDPAEAIMVLSAIIIALIKYLEDNGGQKLQKQALIPNIHHFVPGGISQDSQKIVNNIISKI
ncbi:hypothetical protein [Elstera litoralis]|uniref:hypothetical protein n=1 Tax=Elstera litoralis TaxID=552518 RepID=UPI0012ECBD17|nr:hypothetical protein [Elstera litoralis]